MGSWNRERAKPSLARQCSWAAEEDPGRGQLPLAQPSLRPRWGPGGPWPFPYSNMDWDGQTWDYADLPCSTGTSTPHLSWQSIQLCFWFYAQSLLCTLYFAFGKWDHHFNINKCISTSTFCPKSISPLYGRAQAWGTIQSYRRELVWSRRFEGCLQERPPKQFS